MYQIFQTLCRWQPIIWWATSMGVIGLVTSGCPKSLESISLVKNSGVSAKTECRANSKSSQCARFVNTLLVSSNPSTVELQNPKRDTLVIAEDGPLAGLEIFIPARAVESAATITIRLSDSALTQSLSKVVQLQEISQAQSLLLSGSKGLTSEILVKLPDAMTENIKATDFEKTQLYLFDSSRPDQLTLHPKSQTTFETRNQKTEVRLKITNWIGIKITDQTDGSSIANRKPNQPSSIVCPSIVFAGTPGLTCALTAASELDPDGDSVSYVDDGSTCLNTSINSSSGLATFTGPANNLSCVIRVKAFDGKESSFSVTSNAVLGTNNNPPIASSLSFSVSYNSPTRTYLVATDLDADPLSYTIRSAPAFGILSGTGSSRTYTPNPGYVGSDSFTYSVNDGKHDSEIATVSLTVSATVTIYLREGGSDANDPTDPATPVSTAQRAVNVAIARNPSAAHPVIIDVGARSSGHFGGVSVNSDFGSHVSWRGVNSTQSRIGDVFTVGIEGSASYDDGLGYQTVHTSGTDAPNLIINADGTVSFGNLNSIGGAPGVRNIGHTWNTVSATGGKGGDITTSVGSIVGHVYSASGQFPFGNDYDYPTNPGGNIIIGGTAGQVETKSFCNITSTDAYYCFQNGNITINGSVGTVISYAGSVFVGPGASTGVIAVHGRLGSSSVGFQGESGGTVVVNGGTTGIINADASYTNLTTGFNGGSVTIHPASVVQSVSVNGGGSELNGGNGGTIIYSLTSTTGSKSALGAAGMNGGTDGANGSITTIP